MARTEERAFYQAKWDENNTYRFSLKFNNNTDADIIEKLKSIGNKQAYIKELIRKDLKESGK